MAEDREAFRDLDADRGGRITERLAVLRHRPASSGVPSRRTSYRSKTPGLRERRREVQGGVGQGSRPHTVRALLGDDGLDGLDGQRLEVDRVGDLGVGHDRGPGCPVTRWCARPHSRERRDRPAYSVVELRGLADDRPGQTPGSAPRLSFWWPPGSTVTLSASGGRDEPSQRGERVEWSQHPLGVVLDGLDGQSRWRRPSTDRSLRSTWLTRKPGAAAATRHDLDLVVLGGDLDQAELDVLDRGSPRGGRTAAASVGAGGAADDLVTEADPEQRPAVVDDRAGERDLRLEPRRDRRDPARGSRRRCRRTAPRGGRRVREDRRARRGAAWPARCCS